MSKKRVIRTVWAFRPGGPTRQEEERFLLELATDGEEYFVRAAGTHRWRKISREEALEIYNEWREQGE